MADYDFSTLGSSDLENLVCDLLNASVPSNSEVKYKLFKDGKDKGIDFLYSNETHPYNHVGQVKHYYRTGFDGLLVSLRNTEVAKVKLLAPNKYIFATSLDLTVHQSELIKETFKPFLKSVNDIYGKKDLNMLLANHDDILHRHFKLWFSDTAVLKKILSYDMLHRTRDFVEHELARRIRLHVQTPILTNVGQCLENNRYVIITGEPGVGKTTLAEMLVYKYLRDDYDLLYIHDDIKEAESFLKNDSSKQLIYFDDFLGSNAIEINKAQGSETTLLGIIRRIKKYPSKLLILTTRNHILNTAIDQSENLKRTNIKKAETVFTLREYSCDLKSQLLKNHIEEAEIEPELKAVLEADDIFKFIVDHPSFNPRSVEYITTKENVSLFGQKEYRKFIIDNFNNPHEIWAHAYRNQIGPGERILLNTLLSFDSPVKLSTLRFAVNKRIQKDSKARLLLEVNAFKTALYRLDRGFIVVQDDIINFSNASLKDFLNNFIETDPHEVNLILNSSKYIQQLIWSAKKSKQHELALTEELEEDILLNYQDYIRPNSWDEDLIRLINFISTDIRHPEKNKAIIDALYDIDNWGDLYEDYQLSKEFLEFLRKYQNNQQIQEVLKERTSEIVNDLISVERDVFKAVNRLDELKGIFHLDYSQLDSDIISNHLDKLFDEYISNEIDWLIEVITDVGEVYDKKEEIMELQNKIARLGMNYKINMTEFNIDWQEIAWQNDFRRMLEKDD